MHEIGSLRRGFRRRGRQGQRSGGNEKLRRYQHEEFHPSDFMFDRPFHFVVIHQILQTFQKRFTENLKKRDVRSLVWENSVHSHRCDPV